MTVDFTLCSDEELRQHLLEIMRIQEDRWVEDQAPKAKEVNKDWQYVRVNKGEDPEIESLTFWISRKDGEEPSSCDDDQPMIPQGFYEFVEGGYEIDGYPNQAEERLKAWGLEPASKECIEEYKANL